MFQRIVSLVFVFVSCGVGAQECRSLDCDCDSIPNLEWKKQCQTYLKQAPACETVDKKRNYCQVAGAKARSLPLVVARLSPTSVENLDKSLEKMKLLSWAVREENTAAVTQQDRGDIKAALAKRKNEAKLRRQLHQVSVGVAQHHKQQGKDKSSSELYGALWLRNAKDAELSEKAARELWIESSQISSDPKIVRLLAQRTMRNAALEYELAADLARRDGNYVLAKEYWLQSALAMDTLLGWKRELASKANVIAYYQQSAAARWYQSGLMSLMAEDEETAGQAKSKSEQIWAEVFGLEVR